MADHKADIVMNPHHPITYIKMSIVHSGENERKSSEILNDITPIALGAGA